MGYFDFVARFGTALFDRSSFDWLGAARELGVNLPLSATVTVPDYAGTVTVPDYDSTMEVPDYSATVTVPKYGTTVTVPKYSASVSISS